MEKTSERHGGRSGDSTDGNMTAMKNESTCDPSEIPVWESCQTTASQFFKVPALKVKTKGDP